MSRIPTFESGTGRVFTLSANAYVVDGKEIIFGGLVILTPEPVRHQAVVSAWTHAVRYSAKGIDHPDYDAAVELLFKRHPSWQIVDVRAIGISPNFRKAEEDIPET